MNIAYEVQLFCRALSLMQTFQPPSHANLEVLKKGLEKPGDWDLKPVDFQNMHQIKKEQQIIIILFECFFCTFLVSHVEIFCCFVVDG